LGLVICYFVDLKFVEVVVLWDNVHVVCFDVDNRVYEGKNINELARFCGVGEAIVAWTTRCTFPHYIILCVIWHMNILVMVEKRFTLLKQLILFVFGATFFWLDMLCYKICYYFFFGAMGGSIHLSLH
jgi:hypothetical protein